MTEWLKNTEVDLEYGRKISKRFCVLTLSKNLITMQLKLIIYIKLSECHRISSKTRKLTLKQKWILSKKLDWSPYYYLTESFSFFNTNKFKHLRIMILFFEYFCTIDPRIPNHLMYKLSKPGVTF